MYLQCSWARPEWAASRASPKVSVFTVFLGSTRVDLGLLGLGILGLGLLVPGGSLAESIGIYGVPGAGPVVPGRRRPEGSETPYLNIV